MAHVQKFSRGAVGGLSNHIERKTENHSNKDIDKERTHENYDLCEKDGDMLSRYQERMEEVHCLNRADVKVMADWIVTLPEELKEAPEGSQRRFFEETYGFLADRYGKENVLAGVVHNDETTPHMHFAFMPVTFDEKRRREKVSAKEVLNRKELKTFHQDLDRHLKENIPEIYQKGVLNDKTIGVEDVPTLKKHSKEIEKLSEGMQKKKMKLAKEIKRINTLQGSLENVYDTQKKLDQLDNQMSRTITGKRVLKSKDLNELKSFVTGVQKSAAKSVGEAHQLEEKNTKLASELKTTKKDLNQAVNRRDELIQENSRLEMQNKLVRGDLMIAESKMKDMGYNLSEMPEIEREGHLIISNLERGKKPKNEKTAKNWLDTLEENKNKKLITGERINNCIKQLQAILQKFLERITGLSL